MLRAILLMLRAILLMLRAILRVALPLAACAASRRLCCLPPLVLPLFRLAWLPLFRLAWLPLFRLAWLPFAPRARVHTRGTQPNRHLIFA